LEKLKGRDYSKDIGVDGKRILEWKQGGNNSSGSG
jgi:hypothetical protein